MSRYRKLDKMKDILNNRLSEYVPDSVIEEVYEAATQDEYDNYSSRDSYSSSDSVEGLRRRLSDLEDKVQDLDERLG